MCSCSEIELPDLVLIVGLMQALERDVFEPLSHWTHGRGAKGLEATARLWRERERERGKKSTGIQTHTNLYRINRDILSAGHDSILRMHKFVTLKVTSSLCAVVRVHVSTH